MTCQNVLLYLLTIPMVQGMPASQEAHQIRIPLQHSNHVLSTSSTLHGQTYTHNMKYPSYMLQLYRALIMANHTSLSNLERSVLQDSDTVLSISTKKCTKIDKHRSLYFDMSSLSNINEIRLVELRIHLPPSEKTQNMTLQIYHSKEDSERLLLGSYHIDSSTTLGDTWKVMNVTNILNTYLHLRQSSSFEDYMHGDLPYGGNDSSCIDLSTDRVVLMVFTKNNPSSNINGYPNLIQTVQSSKYVMTPDIISELGLKRNRKKRNAENLIMNHFPSRTMENGKPLCRRVDMMADFQRIGWGNLVIYPKKFNAYRCEGACPIPLNETFKPTNHAYINSLLKVFNSDKVECASCVPVKMKPLSMLIYEDGGVELKHHVDMIVEECGCH